MNGSSLQSFIWRVLLVLFSLAAPAHSRAQSGGDIAELVATTGMVADVVAAVAGDRARVQTLMAPGVDPHLYALTRLDLKKLLRADAVFYNGLNLEGKTDRALQRVRDAGKPVIALAETLPASSLLVSDDGYADPHCWMDVALWQQTVPAVVDTLSALQPEFKDEFARRGAAYQATLAELNQQVLATLDTIPVNNRVLVTAHDAFGYFGRAYNIEVIGVQGVSTESEAGLQRIESLVNLLASRQLPTVFVESSVSDRNVQALIAGAAAQSHDVTIGGHLYSDAMGPTGTLAATYTGMITHNVQTVSVSLGGQSLFSEAALNESIE